MGDTDTNDQPKSCYERLKMKQSTLDKISMVLAELIGTALLVLLGCVGCVKNDSFPNSHLQMTFNFGLVVMIIVQIFGCVSGAHLNPAVTLAAYIYDMISLSMSLAYFVAQMLGAFIGYGVLQLILPQDVTAFNGSSGFCVTTVNSQISGVQGMFIEFIATSVLALVCCGVWDPRNAKFHDSVAIRFGLTIFSLACTVGPFTGGSMNPARSFAPALWNRDFQDHWVYWIGPLAGSAITTITFKAVFRREVNELPINNKLRAMEEVPLS